MRTTRTIRLKNRLISLMPWLSNVSEAYHLHRAAKIWHKEGWVMPPPYFVKRAMIVKEAKEIGAEVFVETGTLFGDTTWSLMQDFSELHTIEVEPSLAALAKERFRFKDDVTVWQGDSAKVLVGLCRSLTKTTLFYLDGHYSGGVTGKGKTDCPVMDELKAIFTLTRPNFRIVIDDARYFGEDPAYASVDEIADFLAKQERKMDLRIENDAILIY